MEHSLGRRKVRKVVRWALYFSALICRIEHGAGSSNIWLDIMTRWMRGCHKGQVIRRTAPGVPLSGVTRAPEDPDFRWPDTAEVCAAQNKHKAEAPCDTTKVPSKMLLVIVAAWIPDEAVDLELRLLSIAQTGAADRHGADPSWHAVRKESTWTAQRNDGRSLSSSLLLCILLKSGNKGPRSLSSTTHVPRPNVFIHFDYVFLVQGE